MPLSSTAYGKPLAARFQPLASRATLGALETSARQKLAHDIASALGSAFLPEDDLVGAEGLPAVKHRVTGICFAAIPGGEFIMGMSPEEIEAVAALFGRIGRGEEARQAVTWASSPARLVKVQPFLCAATPVTDRVAHERLTDIYHGDEEGYVATDKPALISPRVAAELRGALGFRLLSEAEWEWIAREGGARSTLIERPERISFELDPVNATAPRKNAFGIDVYHGGLEFVADAWHKGYEGAPPTAVAWEPRAVPDHARGCPASWVDEIEAIRLWAGVREGRHAGDDAALRFAHDLP